MGPTTESQEKVVTGFYDRLAPEYDLMTAFESRFVREGPFFKILVGRHEITRALDAGAGTGFHSLLLAKLGVEVTAIDVSPAMLRALEVNSSRLHLPVKTVRGTFAELPRRIRTPFDAVFCLGNTLAHLLSRGDLDAALRAFAAVVRPGGTLFLQLVNYERVLASRKRIQSVREAEGATFIRFYDYSGDLVHFNILTIRRGEGGLSHSLETVPLRPLVRADLLPALEEAGFDPVSVHGGIALEEFDPLTSPDLVLAGTRTG